MDILGHPIKRTTAVDKPEWFWYNFYTIRSDDFCGWGRNFRQELPTEAAVLADKKRTLECVVEVTYEKNHGMDSDLGIFGSGDELLRSVPPSQSNTSSPTTTTGQTTPADASGTTEPSETMASTASSASDPTTVSTPTPTESVTPVPADPMEVLKGKTALFCGDSIVMASTHDTKHAAFYGWPGRIKDQYGMSVGKNVGVDGASVSNCRGNNTVVNQVINNSKTKYDFVILEGGVNDAWDCQSIGSPIQLPASETKVADLDLSTLAGGLENLLYRTKKLYPDATIGYVINFKMTIRVGYLTECRNILMPSNASAKNGGFLI